LEEIYLDAPAKINLLINVKGLRADGYHELEMIMQSISLADKIKLKKISSGIVLKNSKPDLPTDEKNLAYQAAEIFMKENKVDAGVEIYIEKNIPTASGMAGGSTDAAAVLRGLYQLFEIEADYDKLRKYLAEIGSDVPYCLEGGTVFASGRGEKLEFLPFMGKKHLMIVTPQIRVSTAEVFSTYDEMYSNGNYNSDENYNIHELLDNLRSASKIDWNLNFKNDLALPAKFICTEIAEIEDLMEKNNPLFHMMSGSGPTVFAFFDSKQKAEKAAAEWPRKNDFVYAAETINRY